MTPAVTTSATCRACRVAESYPMTSQFGSGCVDCQTRAIANEIADIEAKTGRTMADTFRAASLWALRFREGK